MKIAAYIDKKADAARSKGKGTMDADYYDHLAIVLENLADEVRIGLYSVDIRESIAIVT